MVRVLLFAQLGELFGSSQIELAWDGSFSTPGNVRDILLENAQPQATDALRDKRLLVAINQSFAKWNTPLKDGDELAFISPVSGG